jgi:hypothetical protein
MYNGNNFIEPLYNIELWKYRKKSLLPDLDHWIELYGGTMEGGMLERLTHRFTNLLSGYFGGKVRSHLLLEG